MVATAWCGYQRKKLLVCGDGDSERFVSNEIIIINLKKKKVDLKRAQVCETNTEICGEK